MSLERAYMNCEECNKVSIYLKGNSEKGSQGISDNPLAQRVQSKNNAMEALESYQIQNIQKSILLSLSKPKNGRETKIKEGRFRALETGIVRSGIMLQSCHVCKYDEPQIVNRINEGEMIKLGE